MSAKNAHTREAGRLEAERLDDVEVSHDVVEVLAELLVRAYQRRHAALNETPPAPATRTRAE